MEILSWKFFRGFPWFLYRHAWSTCLNVLSPQFPSIVNTGNVMFGHGRSMDLAHQDKSVDGISVTKSRRSFMAQHLQQIKLLCS